MYKVRVGFSSDLVPFNSRSQIFEWVRETQTEKVKATQMDCVFSVLTYENGQLESMDRWFFNGDSFTQEYIVS